MSVLDALSVHDMSLIRNWILTAEDKNVNKERFAPMSSVLRPWSESKQDLFDMMDGKLILEKDVKIPKDDKVLSMEIEDYSDKGYNPIHTFVDDYWRAICRKYPYSWSYIPSEEDRKTDAARHNLGKLINYDKLASNRVGFDGEIELDDGRVYNWDRNSKTMRVLHKICEAMFPSLLDEFEDMRNKVSEFTQNRFVQGTLCLSIHPMDFITASDNDYNWTSCMNYFDGDYHLGTIEMMNSPYVLVAYLKGDKPYSVGTDLSWQGNKKWRCFFYIHRDFVTPVKNYPYENQGLTDAALKWIVEFWSKFYNWEHVYYAVADDNALYIPENIFVDPNNFDAKYFYSIHMETMYNDMNSCQHLYAFQFDTPIVSEDNNWPMNHTKHTFSTQSIVSLDGVVQCMICGSSDEQVVLQNNSVICTECETGVVICKYCNRRVDVDYDNYYETDDGEVVCEYCLEDYTFIDYFTDARYENEYSWDLIIKYKDQTLVDEPIVSQDTIEEYEKNPDPRYSALGNYIVGYQDINHDTRSIIINLDQCGRNLFNFCGGLDAIEQEDWDEYKGIIAHNQKGINSSFQRFCD